MPPFARQHGRCKIAGISLATAAWLGLLAGGTILLGGCASTGPQPRLVADRVFLDNRIELTVAAYADNPDMVPTIRDVTIEVNPGMLFPGGVLNDYTVEHTSGKLGPEQVVSFTAPPGANALDVWLTVNHDGRLYYVKVPLKRRSRYAGGGWMREDERVFRKNF